MRIINGDKIWIWSSYHSISVSCVSLCSPRSPWQPASLSSLSCALPSLAYFIPGIIHITGTGSFINSFFVCLSVCLCLLRTLSPPVLCQMTASLCWWTTPPANGRLQLTPRRRGNVPWRKACMCSTHQHEHGSHHLSHMAMLMTTMLLHILEVNVWVHCQDVDAVEESILNY